MNLGTFLLPAIISGALAVYCTMRGDAMRDPEPSGNRQWEYMAWGAMASNIGSIVALLVDGVK